MMTSGAFQRKVGKEANKEYDSRDDDVRMWSKTEGEKKQKDQHYNRSERHTGKCVRLAGKVQNYLASMTIHKGN